MEFRETYDYQTLELSESKKKGVLGILKGPSFFEDRASRNKRMYKDCWNPALSNTGTKRILEDGLMFGTVGHMDTDLDGLVRDGKVSHRTSQLKMQENGIGHGEFELLDTPLGRFIHMAAKSGSKFAVSSKAMGESKGKDDAGNDRVDPKTFKLERFDIVIDPGFLDAKPELREQLNEAVKEEQQSLLEININDNNEPIYKKEELDMGNTELLESALNEKIEMEKELTNVNKELDVANSKVALFEDVQKEKKSLAGKVDLVTGQLAEYKEFFDSVGSPEEVAKALSTAKATLEAFTDLGSITSVEEALTLAKETQEAISELTDGGVESIEEALQVAKEIGERLSAHGGIDVIEKALKGSHDYITQIRKDSVVEDIQNLSAKFGIDEKKVKPMVESIGAEATEAVLSDLKGTTQTKPSFAEDKEVIEMPEKKSRLSRMMETISGTRVDSE